MIPQEWLRLVRLVACGGVIAAVSGSASLASAQEETVDPVAAGTPAKRRCGLSVGFLLNAHLGTARGYPNDALKINRDDYLTSTGFSRGLGASGWLGIAISDELVFGLGGNYNHLTNGDIDFVAGGGALHADIFPAFGLGGEWREVGIALEAGLSIGSGKVRGTETKPIDMSVGSHASVGVFYEGFRLSKLSMGPYLGADVVWSQSALRPVLAFGWRTAFYLGP